VDHIHLLYFFAFAPQPVQQITNKDEKNKLERRGAKEREALMK